MVKSILKSLACLLSIAAISSGSLRADEKKDIVDTAVAAGSFKTLAAALGAAGLVDTLKGDGPFTVFAPTDEAFAKLPAGTVEELLKPENKAKLIDILTYHVTMRPLRPSPPYEEWLPLPTKAARSSPAWLVNARMSDGFRFTA